MRRLEENEKRRREAEEALESQRDQDEGMSTLLT